MRVSFFVLLFILSAVFAIDARSEVDVSFDAWARATAPGATTGAIYGVLENRGDAVLKLTDVSFESAGHSMVHRTVERDGMMRMIHGNIQLEPGDSVTLQPGGLHIMLMRLGEPLEQGCQYEVTLYWNDDLATSHFFSTGSLGQSVKPDQTGQPCP